MKLPDSTLDYDIVDVFTSSAFTGNQLAVVHGGQDLSTGAMQRIAREFNFSETVFTLPPTTGDADYRVRIFTPAMELPFAGHPSVGTAWVLAERGTIGTGPVTQECGIGLLSVEVDAEGASVSSTRLTIGHRRPGAPLAAAVGLAESDVDSSVQAGLAGSGVSYMFLPVGANAVHRAAPDGAPMSALDMGATGLSVFHFDPESRRVHLRMFAEEAGVTEDPATGSAALALGVWLVDRGWITGDGEVDYVVDQGAEIGRPSTLSCTVVLEGGVPTRTTVRGGVVPVATGQIRVPEAETVGNPEEPEEVAGAES